MRAFRPIVPEDRSFAFRDGQLEERREIRAQKTWGKETEEEEEEEPEDGFLSSTLQDSAVITGCKK